jgi:hypothetical protein
MIATKVLGLPIRYWLLLPLIAVALLGAHVLNARLPLCGGDWAFVDVFLMMAVPVLCTIAVNVLGLQVRRWVLLMLITAALQFIAFIMAPQYICACHGPFIDVFIITAVPVLWSLVLLTIYRGIAERLLAYGALILSVATLSYIQWVSL